MAALQHMLALFRTQRISKLAVQLDTESSKLVATILSESGECTAGTHSSCCLNGLLIPAHTVCMPATKYRLGHHIDKSRPELLRRAAQAWRSSTRCRAWTRASCRPIWSVMLSPHALLPPLASCTGSSQSQWFLASHPLQSVSLSLLHM